MIYVQISGLDHRSIQEGAVKGYKDEKDNDEESTGGSVEHTSSHVITIILFLFGTY